MLNLTTKENKMTKDFAQNILKNVGKLEGDGWTIVAPAFFTKLGFDADLVKSATRRTHSGEGKYQLAVNNKPVPYVDGVYYLTFLRNCCSIVSPDFHSTKMGRGFEARDLLAEITRVSEEA